MNLRERCAARLAQLEHELADFHPDDLDSEELLTYVREGAAHIERFVKQLQVTPSSSSLFDYINELLALGLPAGYGTSLHAIRKGANVGKHDATASVTLQDVRQLLPDARDAVEHVGVTGSASGADAPAPAQPARSYAIFVADYPTHGEVDYEVCTLLDDGRTVTLDRYQIPFANEDAVVASLKASGQLDKRPTTDAVKRVTTALAGSSELSGIWLYEGHLRDVIEAFAPQQHSEALPSLQRQNDSTAVRAATAMAVVDLGAGRVSADHIALELSEQYAARSALARACATRVAALVSAAGVAQLDGPRFVSKWRFDMAAARALARDNELGMAIGTDGVLFVDVGIGYEPMP